MNSLRRNTHDIGATSKDVQGCRTPKTLKTPKTPKTPETFKTP
jgi:hypothetical protein